VLVAADTADDAGVVQLSDDLAIVQTVDFFTPIVDDPYAFGRIAATNAMSDVYAMGGRPVSALNLVAYPLETLGPDVLREILRGGADAAAAAGAAVVGGHSIDDPEPKFGMVVLGEVHPNRMMTNAAARPGDRLVLTKPLGTGILTTGLKRDLIGEGEIREAVRVMTTLNDGAARAALAQGIRAATDITGFGLLGHLGNILAASGVGARLAFSRFPLLPGALELAARGAIPGGTRRNYESASVEWDGSLTEPERLLAVDAQTSGGLLLAVPADRLDGLLGALEREGSPARAVIGEITRETSLTVGR
jgi:selenide,water dikinase